MATPSYRNEGSSLVPASIEAQQLLAGLSPAERKLFEAAFQASLGRAAKSVLDLWTKQEFALTHVILMMSSIDQEDEMVLAREILTWKEFTAKGTARVLCLPTSDNLDSRICSAAFGVVDFPTLVIANSPDMRSFVQISSHLLFNISQTKGALSRFLTTIHRRFELGNTIRDVQTLISQRSFWLSFKLIYDEIKSFITINITNK